MSHGPVGRPIGHPILEALAEACSTRPEVAFPPGLGHAHHAMLTALGVNVTTSPHTPDRCPDCQRLDRRYGPRGARA